MCNRNEKKQIIEKEPNKEWKKSKVAWKKREICKKFVNFHACMNYLEKFVTFLI
jgi:hypothetical protein